MHAVGYGVYRMSSALLDLFTQHAAESLTEAEPYILELEVVGSSADAQSLTHIFRVMHSLRCGAELLRMQTLRQLTEDTETLLSTVLSGHITLEDPMVKAVLRCCSLVRRIIDTGGRSVGAEDEALLADAHASVRGLLHAGGALGAGPEYPVLLPGGAPSLHVRDAELERCLGGETFLYVLEFSWENDIAAKGITPFAVFDYLQKSGLILSVCQQEDGESPPLSRLYILFSTILAPDLVDSAFMIPRRQIHVVDAAAVLAGRQAWTRGSGESAERSSLERTSKRAEPSAAIEGLEELMAEYDRAMRRMREAARVPFEPWDDPGDMSAQGGFGEWDVPELSETTLADTDVWGNTETSSGKADGGTPEQGASHSFSAALQADDPDADLFVDSGEYADQPWLDEELLSRRDVVENEAGGMRLRLEPAEGVIKLDEDAAKPNEDGTQLNEAVREAEEGAASQTEARGVGEPLCVVSCEDRETSPCAGQTLCGFTISTNESGATLHLGADVSVGNAAALREALLELMDSHACVDIDMSAVNRTDLTLIQLLLAARSSAQARGISLRGCGACPTTVCEVLRVSGMDSAILERVGLTTLLPSVS